MADSGLAASFPTPSKRSEEPTRRFSYNKGGTLKKYKMLVVFFGMLAVTYMFAPIPKPQDGNSHCGSMKDNPDCINFGAKKNCDCQREPDENGVCPEEGTGCKNHCCRKKCHCNHSKCTPVARLDAQKYAFTV